MSEPIDADDPDEKWQCLAGAAQILIRSKIEIARFLTEFANRQAPLTAIFPKDGYLFVTQLRHVDLDHEYIMVDYSSNRTANSALLAARSVTFSVPHGADRVDFIAAHPTEALFEGTSCVRFEYPNTLMLNQRRMKERMPVIPTVPLRCIADIGGFLSFECTIVDISRGGVGTMIYDKAIFLAPGTLLKNCKVFRAATTIEIDIEVRYSVPTALPDGSSARRTGFRFVDDADKLDELLNLFVFRLETPNTNEKR